MENVNRVLKISTKFRFLLLVMLLGASPLMAQDFNFCNCDGKFATPTPPQAYQNGVILASQLFRYARISHLGPVTKRCFSIDAPLVFDEPYFRKMYRCNFNMLPGSSITVLASGAGVHFRECEFTGCDSDRWNGIFLTENSKAEIEGSKIYDANIGVQIQDKCDVQIKGNHFFNTNIGIDVTPGAVPVVGDVYSNRFENGYIGVNAMGGLIIGQSEATANTFGPDLQIGVAANDGAIIVKYSNFDSCFTGISGSDCALLDISNCNFDGSFNAIQDFNSNIKISKNEIINNQYNGIQLIGHLQREISIKHNEITSANGIILNNINGEDLVVSNNGINSNNSFFTGIELSNVISKNGKIEENSITENGASKADGILMTVCKDLTVSHNVIEVLSKQAVGLSAVGSWDCRVAENFFFGSQNQTGALLENSQLEFACNQFYDYSNGIVVKGFSVSDIETNSFHNNRLGIYFEATGMSGPQNHNGNQWIDPIERLGAYHDNQDLNFARMSVFSVEREELPLRPELALPLGWFVQKQGNSKECGRGSKSVENPSKIKEEFFQNISAQKMYGEENIALQHDLERYLTKHNLSVNISKKSKTQLSQMEQLASSINEVSDFDNGSLADNSTTQQKPANTYPNIRDLLSENENHQLHFAKALSEKCNAIEVQIDDLMPIESFEQNEVDVQKIHVAILRNGFESIAQHDLELLKMLAEANSSTEGRAVYKARALLAGFESTLYQGAVSTQPMDIQTDFAKAKNETAPDFIGMEVFPNPANEVLNLRLELKTGEGVEAQIFDITGKLVQSKILDRTFINTAHLPEGFYFLKIKESGKEMSNSKFSIAH